MSISKRIDPTLRIHYLISACEGEPAESIEHCVLLDPEQGYTEALRILETLYGNPVRKSDVPVSRRTKGLPSIRKTITSSVPLPSCDSNKKRMKVRSAREIQNSNATNIMENRYLAYFNSHADSGDINLSASSDNYNYCQPFPTIPEWQGRKFLSPSTGYPSRPKVSDSNFRVSKINETSKRHSEAVFMPKFPASSHNHANVSGISGVLQSSEVTNDKKSSGNSKVIRSHLQIKSMSRKGGKLSISDEGEYVESSRVPAHLLTT